MKQQTPAGATRRGASPHGRNRNYEKSLSAANGPEEDLPQLQEKLHEAAEYVFQQRFYIHRLDSTISLSEDAEHALPKSETCETTRTAIQQLFDLEDTLSRRADHYIRVANVTALRFLNEKRYTHALQMLLNVESMTRKGAGKDFPFFSGNDSLSSPLSNDSEASPGSPLGTQAGGSCGLKCVGGVRVVCVPYFTKRHERARERAVAIIENNIGLYHFKIAEYDLAARRMGRALELEESLNVETIGVTYFNLAQIQYELGLVDEALSLISIAEEIIEKRVCQHDMQRSRLNRLSQFSSVEPGGANAAAGDRTINTYIKWREEVCLLARVLDIHGAWLSGKNAFKAAVNRFQQCERWLSSVVKLSKGENVWLSEVRQRIQQCKRLHKRSGYDPRVQAAMGSKKHPSSVPPQSVIVTTTLPRRVEVAMAGNPEPLIEEEQHPRPKRGLGPSGPSGWGPAGSTPIDPRRGGNSLSRIPNNWQSYSSPLAPAAQPQWNNSTYVFHPKEEDDTPTAAPFIVRDFSAYTDPAAKGNRGARSRQSAGSTPMNGRDMPRKLFSSHRAGLAEPWNRRTSRVGNGQGAVEQRLSNGVAQGAKSLYGVCSEPRRPFGCGEFVPSVTWCVRILQAFSRAKVSEFVRYWKGCPCKPNFSHLLGCTGPPVVSCGGNLPIDCPHRCVPGVGETAFATGGLKIRDESKNGNGTLQRHPYDVLLAFVSARRSTRYVHETLLHQKYESISREVKPQHSDPFSCCRCVCYKPSSGDPQGYPEHRYPGGSNCFSVFGSGRRCSGTVAQPCCAACPCAANVIGVSERMWMQHPNLHSQCGNCAHYNSPSVSANKGVNHPVMTVTYVSGPERHTSFNGEGNDNLADRTGGEGGLCCPSLSSKPVGTCVNSAVENTELPTPPEDELLAPSPKWSRGALASLTRSMRAEGDSRSSSSFRAMKLLTAFDCKSRKFPTHATASLMRHRALREEAALIVQAAWREWKERRREEAVRKLANRKIDG